MIQEEQEKKDKLHSALIKMFGEITGSGLEASAKVEERLKKLGYMD